MRALAQFVLRGPLQAVTAVAGFAVAAFAFPPLMLLSGGALALVTLVHGARRGGEVLAAAAVLMTVLGMLLAGGGWFGPLLAAVDWVPVWVCAMALWSTRSLAAALGAGAVLALLAVVAAHLLVQDLPGWWRQVLEPVLVAPLRDMGLPEAELDRVLSGLSKVATGALAASAFVSTVLALWIGRAWQALLYHPGAFGREFRALRLGRTPALSAALAVGVASLWQQPLLFEIALILLVAFAFEGLGFVHWLAHRSERPTVWLAGFYVLLVLVFPQALPVVMGLGVVDGLFDLRGRIAARSQAG